MSISRDSANERKMKAGYRYQWRYKQYCETVDWEENVLFPKINAWKAQAQMPSPPTDLEIKIVEDWTIPTPPTPER